MSYRRTCKYIVKEISSILWHCIIYNPLHSAWRWLL